MMRFCRPIDEGELAITRFEFIHFHFESRLITIFSRGLPDLFRRSLRCGRVRSLVVIVRVHSIEVHLFNDDFFAFPTRIR